MLELSRSGVLGHFVETELSPSEFIFMLVLWLATLSACAYVLHDRAVRARQRGLRCCCLWSWWRQPTAGFHALALEPSSRASWGGAKTSRFVLCMAGGDFVQLKEVLDREFCSDSTADFVFNVGVGVLDRLVFLFASL